VSRYLTSRRLFVLLASVILLITVAGLTLRGGRATSWPERVIMDVQNSVSGLVFRPVSQLTSFFGGIHSLREMYVENANLKTELQDYESLTVQLQDLKAQTAQLNSMLGYKQSTGKTEKLVPAHVVGREPSAWNSAITIDIGLSRGVKDDMAVVAADGSLVGRVADAGQYSSKVTLITDTRLGDGVSALVQNGSPEEPFGIVLGSTTNQGRLGMTFWAPLVQIKVGDMVVTSGMSDVFPKGLLIGSVAQVVRGTQGSALSAEVTPAADLDYLQNVFVIAQTVVPSK